jgi:hypothetical protein
MPRISIQQFRDALSGRSAPAPDVRAYRELARRPDVAAKRGFSEWAVWPPAAAPTA